MRIEDARIGYAPYSPALSLPGDRRRFCYYATARGLSFDIVDRASPPEDLVVLSSTADITHWARAAPRSLIVYDLIDSYLAVKSGDVRSMGRGVAKRLSGETSHVAWSYRKAIEAMCRRADAVVCSTPEQREVIASYCANVHVILDHHGPEASVRKASYQAHAPFRLVWEGLPYTLPAFSQISDVIERAQRRRAVEIHLVTDLEYRRYARRFGRRSTAATAARYLQNVRLHEWHVDTLAGIVTSCDLAIIPAQLDDPMSYGKPENKLLLFWRMAMPTLTSATPAYRRAMDAAQVNMSCASDPDWAARLEEYIADAEARREAGERGYRYARASHSDSVLLGQWDAVLASVGFEVGRTSPATP